jgi:hopene-associated glycosyltransferase HpnB
VSISFGAAVGVLCTGVWIYLVFFRGAFWRLANFDDDHRAISTVPQFPRVCAVVPARNEAATIGVTVAALLQQDYPGTFHVVVVDDHSDDGTANVAKRIAAENGGEGRFAVYSAAPLPQGWTGKLWALNEGVRVVCSQPGQQPQGSADSALRYRFGAKGGEVAEYLWFTDADVQHAPDTLRRLVARAEDDHLDLASLMVLLRARTFPEKLLIPAFVYFFLQLYPPQWIANPKSRTAGAAGGCLLIRSSALQRIGGPAAIRDALIDDCTLARAVKNAGGRLWMGVTRASASLRGYRSFAEIRDMIARTAFTQLRYSASLLILTIVALFLTYIAPVALLFAGTPISRILGVLSCVLMAASFLPTVRYYRLSPTWVLPLPLTAVFYAQATLLSAVRFWLGHGGQWKGRAQAPSSS